MNKKTGVVKWFSYKKGYGFIKNENGEDVFVHYSVIPGKSGNRSLNVGDVVEYIEEQTDDGLRATSVLSFKRGSK